MSRIAALLGLMVVVCPSVARPCGNGVLLEQDVVIKRLSVAERLIEEGSFREARKRLVLRGEEVILDERLDKRRVLLLAVVNLRLGKTRAAERTFRRFLRHRKDDPVLRAWLAEALEGRTGFPAVEAWRILDDLERRDLVPEAEAWASLARLRHRDHDEKGRDRAAEKCRAVARNPAMCPAFASLAAR